MMYAPSLPRILDTPHGYIVPNETHAVKTHLLVVPSSNDASYFKAVLKMDPG